MQITCQEVNLVGRGWRVVYRLWSAIILYPRLETVSSCSSTWLHEDNAVLDIRPRSRDNKSE